MSPTFRDVHQRLVEIVGPDHVVTDPARLTDLFPSTYPDAHLPLGVVRPASADEVSSIVTAAGDLGIALYPISRGRNWGYGDACPTCPGAVVVDLGRMNAIRHIDKDLAYAVIEPGVTQGQLAQALEEQGADLWFDSTGAGPEASIVGNVMERGFGHTAYGDRIRTVSGMEVVMADGSLLRTGFGDVKGSAVGAVYPYGIGPYLDGLFTQSAFGIVTEMTIWLMPKPSHFAAAICQLRRDEDIFELLERLRPLRLDETLRNIVHIGNDLRLISGAMRYPYDRAGGLTPLPEGLRKSLRQELGVAPWSFSAALHGDAAQVRAAKAKLKRALRGLDCRLIFLDDRKMALARRVAGMTAFLPLGRALHQKLDQAEPAVGLLKGKPSEAFLAGAYWRSRRPVPVGRPLNPAEDGCGIIWVGPVLPATARELERFLDVAEPVFRAHGFDFLLTLSFVTARSLSAIMTITYDRDDAGERDKARACHRELIEVTARAGYPVYRGHGQAMDLSGAGTGTFWGVVRQIKDALDPNRVIAPGRYDKGEMQ
jgi:4-cresol dehydrogenase (hydroxylating)